MIQRLRLRRRLISRSTEMWSWWPWSKKIEVEEEEDDNNFPEEYCQGGKCVAKGKRAKQLHEHDHKSREILDDLDKQLTRLQRITEKIRCVDLKKQFSQKGD